MEFEIIYKRLILYAFLFSFIFNLISAYCNINGNLYDNNVTWQKDCKNCTCIDSVPFCEQIQCKYEQCKKGQVLMLSNYNCCPSCQYPKKSCKYKGVPIDHNTEFSPKLCETCRCRDGSIECSNTCLNERSSNKDLCSINGESKNCINNDVCLYDGREYKNNTIWSPIPCTVCKCENKMANCFVMECPIIECPFGYEIRFGECCPSCKAKTCSDDDKIYNDGDMWTRKSDQCTHCSCANGKTSCFTQNCTFSKCNNDEMLVSISNQCCPKCVSKLNEHCEYFGKTYYNGEMWYMNGCQHCSCDYGRVMCTNVECESKFCFKDEIMVKRKDDCCVECRKPIYCQIDNSLKIKESEFWSPDSCKICQCVLGESKCYIGDCFDPSAFATHSQMTIKYLRETELSIDNLSFLKNLKKLLNKESAIQVVSGPKYGSIYVNNKRRFNFTLSDLELSRVLYKQYKEDSSMVDNVVFVVVSPYTGITYTSLVKLNTEMIQNDEGTHLTIDTQNDDSGQKKAHKTIHVVPGEAAKLTSADLKPKQFNIDPERLVYALVSGKPKFGEIKLKKLIGFDDNMVLKDWSQVNDIYVEKTIKTFTQSDLDNGNVWYEPFNNYDEKDDCHRDYIDVKNDPNCLDPNSPECLVAQDKFNSQCFSSFGSSNSFNTPAAKYDHLLFEAYDKEKLDQPISKEIIHFYIQNQIVNETILGLEVIENHVTPFTFSNFDIAGIDSNREYLVYKIIKPLDKNQGQLEHSTKPGIPIQTFTQNDLNKGYVLYNAPKEIGVYPKEFTFTFIVTNDNRSDTFPETPFHIRVLPSNDQAPIFKNPMDNLKMMQSGTLTLSRELFEVEDPDTAIDNLIFTVDKTPDNFILELRSKGHQNALKKDESFTMQEIRNGTFRLIHNSANLEKDSFKISVSDGKHTSVKTVNINVQLTDKIAPHLEKHTSLLLSVKEGQNKMIRRENLVYVDDKSSTEDIVYKLTPSSQENLVGKLFLRNKQLKPPMTFTQADIDLQNLRYEAPKEIGAITVNDQISFIVSDKEGNTIKDQVFTVTIEPVDNQSPIVEVTHPAKVQEGGYLVLNENYIRVRDVDSVKEQLNIVIDSAPSFGYFENTATGTKVTSFPLVNLISGQLIRYIQSEHKNKEPNADSFIFHVTDGLNQSPTYKFTIDIELINDEPPIAVFEPLYAEFNKKTAITNETFMIVDLDSKPETIIVQIEELPKYGALFLNDNVIDKNTRFFYSNILNKKFTYKNAENFHLKDEIKFKITDGKFTTAAIYQIILKPVSKDAPTLIKNDGLTAISGHIFPITKDILYSVNKHNPIIYKILRLPLFGKLQYRSESIYSDFGTHSNIIYFTQKDIDEEKIYYNHASDESCGVTYMTYNLTDKYGNVLQDQKFTIIVRDDKIPPVVIQNKGIKVNQGQSVLLTRSEFDVKDDDTSMKNIIFKIVSSPKYGYIEDIREPGKIINTFTYDQLNNNYVKYTHNNTVTDMNVKKAMIKDDQIDIRISDGKNDVIVTLVATIMRNDNSMPTLESSFTLRVKELSRKLFTKSELNIIDVDTPSENLKFIITHPPQFGIIERVDKRLESIQTQKNKHKFELNKNQTISLILLPTPTYAVSVSEFTMKDIEDGFINYYHKTTGVTVDRFGFIIFDGVNNMFIVNGVRTTSVQLFTIHIDSETNKPPIIEKNLGIDYLYGIDKTLGRMITKNEWNIIDKDDDEKDLIVSIQQQPLYGILEHKDRPGMALNQLNQNDISQNKIFYILKKQDDIIADDHFMYNVIDSAKNSVKNNRFDIRWSVVNFEIGEITVMEDEGKVRVHVTKTGNLKQYSMVSCKTLSDTAKSNRDSKSYDFIHTVIKLEFNEGESYKACDIVINKDSQIESIESFYVVLEDPKYSIIGSKNKVKINILDKQKAAIVEFDKIKFDVQESDKLVSLPIIRSGDLSVDVQVECYTQDMTANANADYVPRYINSFNYNLVKIPAGEVYGFCDIEIIDDDVHELSNELFKALLTNPTQGVQIGSKNEAKISIIGPNDEQKSNCKHVQFTVSENSEQVIIDIHRENADLSQEFDVLCTTNLKMINHSILSTDIQAVPNEDYIPVNNIIKFLPGELSKKCYVPILNDINSPIMEGQKVLVIQVTPISKSQTDNSQLCHMIDPDFVHVTIDDTIEDSVKIGFNQTNFVVQETSQFISLPLIRNGDLSQAVSVICYTRQLTAIEDTDYKGRYTLEQSRIYFEKGEKMKYCNIEIIDDTIYEADETFQVKLSDIRGTKDASFDRFTLATVTIMNEEDATIISLSDENYYTEEPSSNDSLIIKPITIIRTGDLSRNSIVRVTTADNTAIAGQDFKPKTDTVIFEPGVSALDFDIRILFDAESENVESFKVILGPQDPVSAIFGKVKSANVFIKDNGASKSILIETPTVHDILTQITYLEYNPSTLDLTISLLEKLGKPLITSLSSLENEDQVFKNNNMDVPAGIPLICIHACESIHPNYSKTHKLCEALSSLNILYSWEISTPNKFGSYSTYVKLTDNTILSNVNQSILEEFYFRPKFRIRCTTQFSKSPQSMITNSNSILKSEYIEINKRDYGTCSNIDIPTYTEFSSTFPEFTSNDNFVNTQIFEDLVNVKADYISQYTDLQDNNEFIEYVQVSVNVPYIDGMIPLISTTPLHSCRYLMTENDYAKNHICSNFINKSESFKSIIRYGFMNNDQNQENRNVKARDNRTLEFYSNLNSNECQWKFTAYYDIDELINHCHATLTPESDIQESSRSFMTLKIPLFISYVYASDPIGWNCIEYKTDIETSINYRVAFDDARGGLVKNVLTAKNIESENTFSLTVTKISFQQDKKLFIEFMTLPSFHGNFVKSHPMLSNYRSKFSGPNYQNTDYTLDLFWNQYTQDQPKQIWRVRSTESLNNYAGNYTLELIPCIYKDTDDSKTPMDCEPQIPIRYTIPMIIEQTIRPVPIKYSLDTNFDLANKPLHSTRYSYDDFDGYFRYGDIVYGTVSWNSKQDPKASYKLELDKVVLCSAINGYMPIYDPDGTIYKRGPKLGCLEAHKSLSNKLIVLDRNKPLSVVKQFRQIQFDAEFFSNFTYSNLTNTTVTSDSFKLSVNPLFEAINQTQTYHSSDNNWYIQVFFYIRPSSSKLNRRDNDKRLFTNLYNLNNNIFNNGTNIQTLKLGDKRHKILINSKKKSFSSFETSEIIHSNRNASGSDLFLKILIPLLIIITLISIILVTTIYYRRRHLLLPVDIDTKVPPFPKVTQNGDTTSVTIVSLPSTLKSDYTQKTGTMRTKIIKTEAFNNDDSNCTLQTVLSSTASSTNSHESCYGLANDKHKNNSTSQKFFSNKKLRNFIKKMYTPLPTDDIHTDSEMATTKRSSSINTNSLKKSNHNKSNNYLYFNYTNNSSEISQNSNEYPNKHSSSVKSLLLNLNPGKTKRFSGTEV